MHLAISTATAACSAALIDGEILIAERHETVGRGHAERLIPMIESLPGKGRADMIWVDCGPGSFTGVRVGLAAARALALAWEIPLAGFSSLALLAAGVDDCDDETIGIATPGGHGELFVQSFTRFPLAPAGAFAALTPGAAAGHLLDRLVIGAGAAALVEARGYGEARDMLPRAADAGRLPAALRSLAPIPIYGRAPDAVAK